jgi:hypothetical protein
MKGVGASARASNASHCGANESGKSSRNCRERVGVTLFQFPSKQTNLDDQAATNGHRKQKAQLPQSLSAQDDEQHEANEPRPGPVEKADASARGPAEVGRILPWAELMSLIALHYPEGHRDRPPFNVEAMLRIHVIQQWLNLSNPAMEEAPSDPHLLRDSACQGG